MWIIIIIMIIVVMLSYFWYFEPFECNGLNDIVPSQHFGYGGDDEMEERYYDLLTYDFDNNNDI